MHPILICLTLIVATFGTNGARHPFWNRPYESDEIEPVLPFQPVRKPDNLQPLAPDAGPQTFHSAPPGCSCPTTRQFNPVCGTDGNTYRNLEIMNCYVQCGVTRTTVRYSGACRQGGR